MGKDFRIVSQDSLFGDVPFFRFRVVQFQNAFAGSAQVVDGLHFFDQPVEYMSVALQNSLGRADDEIAEFGALRLADAVYPSVALDAGYDGPGEVVMNYVVAFLINRLIQFSKNNNYNKLMQELNRILLNNTKLLFDK